MYVNEPLKFGGVTAYQTDWGMSAATIHVGNAGGQQPGRGGGTQPAEATDVPAGFGDPVRLPMAALEGVSGFSGRIWGTVLPTGPPGADGRRGLSGATLLARDFQSVAIYDSQART